MGSGIQKIFLPIGRKKRRKLAELNERINHVDLLAEDAGWDYWGWDSRRKEMEFRQRVAHDEYIIMRVRIRKEGKYIIQTELRHPKRGYRKLRREDADLALVARVFRDPRAHTGYGKYVR